MLLTMSLTELLTPRPRLLPPRRCLVVLFVPMLLAGGCGGQSADAPASAEGAQTAAADAPRRSLVATMAVEPQEADVTLPPRVGRLEASRHRALGFEVAGRLEHCAGTGDRVEAGGVLAQLDNTLEARQLQRAQLLVDEARRELERVQGLRESAAASGKALDAARTALGLRRTELAIAVQELERRTLKAPYAGVVGETRYEPGEVVAPGAVALALLDLTSLKLELGVPSAQIGSVQLDARVDIDLPTLSHPLGAKRLEGRVVRIAPAPERDRHLYEVEVRVPNEGGELRAGIPARGRIVTQRLEAAIPIPLELVVERAGRRVVFFAERPEASDPDRAMARGVDVSSAHPWRAGLLVPADRVPFRELVVRGQRDLYEGALLRIDDAVLARVESAASDSAGP